MDDRRFGDRRYIPLPRYGKDCAVAGDNRVSGCNDQESLGRRQALKLWRRMLRVLF